VNIAPDQLPLPKAPYRGILPFRLLDWRIFMERDLETERLANLVSMYRGVLLYGQSGAGKSSLLNAGLLPHLLGRGRAPERIRVFPKCGHELVIERIRLREQDEMAPGGDGWPAFLPSRFTEEDNDDRVELSCEQFLEKLRAPSELGVPLLLFDQFEELVTLFEENPKEKDQFQSAQEARAEIEEMLRELLLNDPLPVKIIFSFRDDYLARLTPLLARIPNLLDQRVLLVPPRMELVKQIVRGPFTQAEDGRRGLPGQFQNELSEALADKIAAGLSASQPSDVVNLSELQTLCLGLWLRPERGKELLAAAKPEEVLQKILVSEARLALKKLHRWEAGPAIVLLSNLVTSAGTRDVVSEEKLISQTGSTPAMWIFRWNLRKLLAKLPEKTGLMRRSLSAGNTYYEITSEFLVPWIQREQQRIRNRTVVFWAAISLALLLLLSLTVVESQRAENGKKAAVAAFKGEMEAKAAAEEDRRRAQEGESKAKAAETKAIEAKMAADAALAGEKKAKAAAEEARQRAEENEKTAKESSDKAIAAKKDAEALIRFMQYDLREKLEKLGHIDMMDSINSRIIAYHQEHPAEAGDLAAQREEAVALSQRGDVLKAQGDLKGALKSYRDSLAIRENLAKQDAANTFYQRDLVLSYNEIGLALEEQGDFAGALKSYRDDLAMSEKLAKQEPTNGLWKWDLAVSYGQVGNVLEVQGDLNGALKSYFDGLAIWDKFAKQDPANDLWQRALSVSHNEIGNVLKAQGDLAGAQKNYRDSIAMAETLVKRDPGNAEWQRDLSISYDNAGIVLTAQLDWAGALKSYRDELAIIERLANQDPGNAEWQRNLSVTYEHVGEVLEEQGDLADALKSYRDELAIVEKLAKQDPGNARWQADLARSCWRTGVGWAKAEPASSDQARAMVERGRKVLGDLKQHVGLTAQQQGWLDSIEAALKVLHSAK
jgi:tetratricopeptide (TPR) repeat protein